MPHYRKTSHARRIEHLKGIAALSSRYEEGVREVNLAYAFPVSKSFL
jgi:hypothetical protein